MSVGAFGANKCKAALELNLIVRFKKVLTGDRSDGSGSRGRAEEG